MQITYYTVLYPTFDAHVLFGLKRRKFCAGAWVGLGGKMLPGESIAAGALREAGEEAPELCLKTETLRLCEVLDVDEGTSLRRVFILLGEVEKIVVPAPTPEFEAFAWHEKVVDGRGLWAQDSLPSPLPLGEEEWTPLLFDHGAPLFIRTRVDGRQRFFRDERLRHWYDPIADHVAFTEERG